MLYNLHRLTKYHSDCFYSFSSLPGTQNSNRSTESSLCKIFYCRVLHRSKEYFACQNTIYFVQIFFGLPLLNRSYAFNDSTGRNGVFSCHCCQDRCSVRETLWNFIGHLVLLGESFHRTEHICLTLSIHSIGSNIRHFGPAGNEAIGTNHIFVLPVRQSDEFRGHCRRTYVIGVDSASLS